MATRTSTATLADLKKRVRERADMVDSEFVDDTEGDSELVRLIQQSYRKLYNLVVSSFSDFYVEDPVEFTISSGNTYDLDTDFYKLVGVDYSSGGRWVVVPPFNFNNRNVSNSRIQRGVHSTLRYRLMGSVLRFIPTDNATGTYRYWYIKKPNVPVDDSDTIEGYNGWDEFVVIDAAIKCKDKEESDIRYLVAELEQLKNDIIMHAQSRDEGESQSVQDVQQYDEDFYF